MFTNRLKIIVLFQLILVFILVFSVFKVSFADNSCPSKTTAGSDYIIFVGKVTSMGNDKEVQAWFEYGENTSNLKSTKKLTLYKEGIYCLKVSNLKSCQNYFYRAGVANQAGKSYGEIKEIKTLCSDKTSVSSIKKPNSKSSKSKIKINSIQKSTTNNLASLLLEDSYQVKKCSPSDINLTLINNTSVKRKITLEAKGEAGSWFEPQEREFILDPKERMVISWKIYPPCQLKSDKYQATFSLTTPGFTKDYQTTLEIKSSEANNPLSAFAFMIFNNFPWFLVFVLFVIALILLFLNLRISKKTEVNLNSSIIK